LAVAHTFLSTYFQGMRLKQRPPLLIVTGGSANSLLLLARHAFRLDMTSNRLTYHDLTRCEGLLSALTAEEISQRYGQPVARARILPAGALIIQEVMSRLNLQEIAISPHGIREGVLLAYARYGEDWLERVNEEASAANQGTSVKNRVMQAGAQEEVFAQSARRMLLERTKKLLDWHDEVLKNEDVEAVHKMRVASRRLRATLDAYEPCCKPGQFKKVYRRIKKVADALGTVRDTDVMLEGLRSQLEQVSSEERTGMQWLIDRLDIYRQQRQQVLETRLSALDEDVLKQQILSSIREGEASDGKS